MNRCPSSQLVTLPRVPAAMEALVEALESDLLQLEWLLSALHESAHSGMRRLRHCEAMPGVAMQDTQPNMAATHAPCPIAHKPFSGEGQEWYTQPRARTQEGLGGHLIAVWET